MLPTWRQFALCVIVITVAGYKLSIYGSVTAGRTGTGDTLVGLVLIGLVLIVMVTPLPGPITGISAATLTNAPDTAIGSLPGSCMFNPALLVMPDFLYREPSVYSKANQGHLLSAGFGIVVAANGAPEAERIPCCRAFRFKMAGKQTVVRGLRMTSKTTTTRKAARCAARLQSIR